MRIGKLWIFTALIAGLFAGCGSDTGNLSVLIEAEEIIPDDLQAGDGE